MNGVSRAIVVCLFWACAVTAFNPFFKSRKLSMIAVGFLGIATVLFVAGGIE